MINYKKKGFTLIEILVALAILGIVLAAIYEVYLSGYRTSLVQEQVADMQQNARVALDQITRELQMAGYDPDIPGGVSAILGPLSGTDLTGTSTNTITFQGDIDNDGVRETVTYALADTGTDNPFLQKTVDENGDGVNDSQTRLASNIDALTFTFYDENNNLTTKVSGTGSVRRITVAIRARTERRDRNWTSGESFAAGQGSFRTRTLTSDVVLRNTRLLSGDTTLPLCPTITNVQPTGNCGVLSVNWTKPADIYGDLEGYYIYYDTSAIPAVAPSALSLSTDGGFVNVLDQTLSQYDVSGLTNGTPYFIAMSSYDRSGNFCSPVAVFGGSVSPNDTTTPKAPDGLSATPAENQVTIGWNSVTKNTDNSDATDLTGYRVYRSTNSDMSSAITLADESALTISITTAGRVEDTSYTDNTTYSGTNAPVNCTTYYYRTSVVDACGNESGFSSIVSATPPNNNKAPYPPTITSLYAGDDTSSIILNWSIPSSNPNPNGYSDPVGYRVYYSTSASGPWTQWGEDITNLSTTTTTINRLATNTTYYVRVSTYDSAAECNNETFSSPQNVSTAACAPRVNPPDGGQYIYPDTSAQGTPLSNYDTVGTGSGALADSRYITWVADPYDCTPTSQYYGRLGFDYNNPPTYDYVSPNARVAFYVDDTRADYVYGLTRSSSYQDYAARSDDGFYHFYDSYTPVYLDTINFCDGLHEFKVLAIDGEEYTATNIIPIYVDNGGINIDSSAVVTSSITTSNDYHNVVRIGLRNTNTNKDLNITKMTLSWSNSYAYLKKLEVLDSSSSVIGLWEDTDLTSNPAVETWSGTEVTLTAVPTVYRSGTSGDTATVRLTFTYSDNTVTSNLDMREETVTINSVTIVDNSDSNFVCSSGSLGTVSVPLGPVISTNDTVQNKPTDPTTPQTTPGIIVQPGNDVTVSTYVTPQSGTSVSSVRLYWTYDTSGSSTAPTRPSTTGGGGNYSYTVTGSYNSGTYQWTGTISSSSYSNSRIWYYLEGIDSNGNFDIHPDSGAFTYAQCGTTAPTVSIISPTNVANWITTVQASASADIGLQTVEFWTVRQSDGVTYAGPNTMTYNSGTGYYEGQYDAGSSIKHWIYVRATDLCGNTTTVQSGLIN